MAGDPETVPGRASDNDSVPPTTVDEALDLLRTIHKKVGRLEKRLEAQAEATEALKSEVKALSKVVARKKHLKRLKKVLDQLEVVELADGGSADGNIGN